MSAHDLVLTRNGVRFAGRMLPCSIGRGGVTASKREGDGATPAGIYRVTGLLYRPDRMCRPADWAEPILPTDLWSDDVNEPDYNQPVQAPYSGSHEAMRRPDPLYDIVLVTDWNWPIAEPGRGSAIFLHIWRRPHFPTAGCIAFSKPDMSWLVRKIAPGTRVIVPDALSDQP